MCALPLHKAIRRERGHWMSIQKTNSQLKSTFIIYNFATVYTFAPLLPPSFTVITVNDYEICTIYATRLSFSSRIGWDPFPSVEHSRMHLYWLYLISWRFSVPHSSCVFLQMLFFYSHLPVNVASCWIIDVLKQFIIKHFSSLLSSRLKIKHNQAIYSLQLENTDYTMGDSCARDHTYLECDLAYCLLAAIKNIRSVWQPGYN